MVNPLELTALTDELQRLRATLVRHDRHMVDRLQKAQREARRLHDQACGTADEPALRSVENLLGCLERGLLAKDPLPNPTSRFRRAG